MNSGPVGHHNAGWSDSRRDSRSDGRAGPGRHGVCFGQHLQIQTAEMLTGCEPSVVTVTAGVRGRSPRPERIAQGKARMALETKTKAVMGAQDKSQELVTEMEIHIRVFWGNKSLKALITHSLLHLFRTGVQCEGRARGRTKWEARWAVQTLRH